MSGIFGWVGVGSKKSATIINDMQASHSGPSTHHDTAHGARWGLGQVANQQRAHVYRHGDWAIAIHGYPRIAGRSDREALAPQLVIDWERRGSAALARLHGEFSLIMLNEKTNEAVIAVDRKASRGMAWATHKQGLLFASNASCFKAVTGFKPEIDSQAIYNYLYFHMIPAPRTAWRGVNRLEPGCCVSFSGGQAKVETYWQAEYVDGAKVDQKTLHGEMHELLRQSVRDAVQSDNVGCFLSGGLDSSTVAGVLKEVTGESRTYSIGFDAEGYDETGYARIASKHFGTNHHEYYVTPDDVVKLVPEVAQRYDSPFGNASAVPAYFCAKLAADDGITQMLGGDGGDELFGGNDRYAKQWLLSLYDYLPGVARSRLVEPLAAAMPGISLIGKAKSYVEQATAPMPERMNSYNLMERLGNAGMLSNAFAGHIHTDEPNALISSVYHGTTSDNIINRMLEVDWKFTLADNDLPKVQTMCQTAGVDITFPLLDDNLVAFAHRLPANLKLRGTQLRYFFRQAQAQFLPVEILEKEKHGFGLPFGVWLQEKPQLKELAGDSLSDFRKRGLIQESFIDQLMGDKVGEHAAYFGTLVWVFILLEQWLAVHAPDYRI